MVIVGGSFTAILIIAVIVFGGWQLGWWFNNQNENRTTLMIRNSIGYQSNLASEIDGQFQNIETITAQIQSPDVQGNEVIALKAEQYADLSQLCELAQQAHGGTLNAQQSEFIYINCIDGAVSPSSSYSGAK